MRRSRMLRPGRRRGAPAPIPVLSAGAVAASGEFDGTSGFTDFSQNTLGQAPSDWTKVFDGSQTMSAEVVDGTALSTPDPLGGQVMQLTIPTSDLDDTTYYGWSWDPAGDQLDGEILILCRLTSTSGFEMPGPAHRLGFPGSQHEMVWFTQTKGASRWIEEHLDGARNEIWTTTSLPRGNDMAWTWMRFRVLSGVLQARWWEDGGSEPAAWNEGDGDQSLTTASDPPAGPPGFAAEEMRDSEELQISYFAVTADPAGAPLEVPS